MNCWPNSSRLRQRWRGFFMRCYNGGMDVNPYEAPQQDSYKPNPKTVLVLRMLAVIAWTACLAVIAVFFAAFAIFEDFGRRRGLPTNVLIGFVVAIGLP